MILVVVLAIAAVDNKAVAILKKLDLILKDIELERELHKKNQTVYEYVNNHNSFIRENVNNICENESKINFDSFSQMLENNISQELEILPEITKVVIANEPEITTVISTFSGSAISTCLFIISIIICRSL